MTLLALSVLTGVLYPVTVTLLAQLCCAHAAGGSLLRKGETLVGSALLAQPFDRPGYFWPRPSATAPQPYDPRSSGGSNLGPTNSAQVDAVKRRVAQLQAADPDNRQSVPVDLVTASGSGLDPDISPAAAEYQVPRVARARGLPEETVRAQVTAHTQQRQWGIFGEPRVNVLELNLALDAGR